MQQKFVLRKLEEKNQLELNSLGSISLDIPSENFSLCMTRFFLESLPIAFVKEKQVIDFGTGNGILSILCTKLGASHVLATDFSANVLEYAKRNIAKNNINENTVKLLRIHGFNLPASHQKTTDLILSNPAQIPVAKKISEAHDYDQGKEGRHMINELITHANDYLNDHGILLMTHSSLSNPEKTIDMMKKQGFKHKIIATRQCYLPNVFTSKEQLDYLKALPVKLTADKEGYWWYNTFFLMFSR